jgi:predicted DNA-binding ribbon-helix-helix protein
MLIKRSFSLAGHRTSIALEPEFWAVLEQIAAQRAIPLSRLVAELDGTRNPATALASSLRILALHHAAGSILPPR